MSGAIALEGAIKALAPGDWVKSKSGNVIEIEVVESGVASSRYGYHVPLENIIEVRKANPSLK